jgi:hypothetical protein
VERVGFGNVDILLLLLQLWIVAVSHFGDGMGNEKVVADWRYW